VCVTAQYTAGSLVSCFLLEIGQAGIRLARYLAGLKWYLALTKACLLAATDPYSSSDLLRCTCLVLCRRKAELAYVQKFLSMCATSLCQHCLSVHLQLVKYCKSIQMRLYTDKDSKAVMKSFRCYITFLFVDACLMTSKVRVMIRQN
jgi:hypothetical protein